MELYLHSVGVVSIFKLLLVCSCHASSSEKDKSENGFSQKETCLYANSFGFVFRL